MQGGLGIIFSYYSQDGRQPLNIIQPQILQHEYGGRKNHEDIICGQFPISTWAHGTSWSYCEVILWAELDAHLFELDPQNYYQGKGGLVEYSLHRFVVSSSQVGHT